MTSNDSDRLQQGEYWAPEQTNAFVYSRTFVHETNTIKSFLSSATQTTALALATHTAAEKSKDGRVPGTPHAHDLSRVACMHARHDAAPCGGTCMRAQT